MTDDPDSDACEPATYLRLDGVAPDEVDADEIRAFVANDVFVQLEDRYDLSGVVPVLAPERDPRLRTDDTAVAGGGHIVHVLLRETSDYVELPGDTVSTSCTELVDVFASEAAAEKYLRETVREPLHRDYEIEKRRVRSLPEAESSRLTGPALPDLPDVADVAASGDGTPEVRFDDGETVLRFCNADSERPAGTAVVERDPPDRDGTVAWSRPSADAAMDVDGATAAFVATWRDRDDPGRIAAYPFIAAAVAGREDLLEAREGGGADGD